MCRDRSQILQAHDLERMYVVLYQPLRDKQFEIINAIYEPTEKEYIWKPDGEDEILENLKKAKIKNEKNHEEEDAILGTVALV